MRLVMRERFLREERGFTLTEMMITIVIWIVILFALYSIFDMSIKAFSFGNNKAEAMENARLGVEKMEREIRQASAFNNGAGDAHLFDTMEETQIAFGNDLDGNEIIECPNTNGDCELISYSLDGSTLMRTSGGGPQPAVEHVEFVEFTYLEADGTTETTIEPDVALVRIRLGITVNPGTHNEATQNLTTEVDLRNRQ
jgi:prepilin-type N-terminal cleavage/methylation domain-containing protein